MADPKETAPGFAAPAGEVSHGGANMPIDEAYLRSRQQNRPLAETPTDDKPLDYAELAARPPMASREALPGGDQTPRDQVDPDGEARKSIIESRAMAIAQGGNRVALLPPDEHPKDGEPKLPYMLTERAFHDGVMCRAGDIVMVRPSQRGPHHQELPDVDYPKDDEPIGDWHHEAPRFESMTTVPLDEHERIVNELKSHHEHELAKLRDEHAAMPAGDSSEVARLHQAIAERDAELARLKLMTRNQ